MTDSLSALLPDDIELLARKVLKFACDNELTVATAESCTGGLVSSILTDVEGLSHAFERGFSTYTDEAKTEMLGVPAGLIERHGAVSAEVARAMSKGALANSHADAVIAVTGFAGSAGPDDEVGLCYFEARRRGGKTATREIRFGNAGRATVREGACLISLELLYEVLKS